MPINRIAETPFPSVYDEDDDVAYAPAPVRDPGGLAHPAVALIGRACIAAIFLASGVGKLADLDGTAQMMTHQGIPLAHTLALIAGLAEVLGGLALVFGLLTRLAAAGLVCFLIPTTVIFHDFWNYQGVDQQMQMVNFMKNLAIVGGLLVVSAFGPGLTSVDARVRRTRSRTVA